MANEAESLESIFTGEELESAGDTAQVETTEEPTKVEDTAPEGKSKTDDQGDAETTAAEVEKKDEPWHIKAVLDEREKRQKAQQRAEELERRLADLEKTDDVKAPDVFEDQEGFAKHIDSKAEKREKENENARLQDRIDMSTEVMSMFHDDYAEREAEFMKLAKEDPTLRAKLINHKFPAKFAYETAIKHAKLQEMENVEEWEAKKEAEIRAKIEAEFAAKQDADKAEKDQLRESVTPSLANSRSAGGNSTAVEDSLDDVLTSIK